jgi:hypothetical protein
MKIIIDECVPHIVKKRLPERFGGRRLKIIFQLKPNRIVRIITGWDV